MHYYNYLIIIILNSIFLYLFCLQYFDQPQTFALEPVYSPKIISSLVSRCPKIIHQIVPNIKSVPSGLYNTIMHNIRMNPEFEYRVYDYASALEILKKEFNANHVAAFTSTDANQLKSDFIKYAFISKYGGFFLDIKYICIYRFIDMLKHNNVYYVQIKGVDNMNLALLASHQDNPAINRALDTASANLVSHNYCNQPSRITGGTIVRDELFNIGYLSEYVHLNMDTDDNVILKYNQKIVLKKYDSFEFENYTNHLLPDIVLDYTHHLLFKETLHN